jgi:hypothetical protein
VFSFSPIFSQETFDVKSTEAILITVASSDKHDKLKPNGDEAMWISDKNEIAKFVNLFDGNQKSVTHACGYHWRITFIRNSAEPFDIWFNQNCEEFEKNTAEICETVQSTFNQIKRNPTHFVTEIGIDVNNSPDEVLSKLKENPEYKIFLFSDPDKRFPFVEIESKAVSEITDDRSLWNIAKEKTKRNAENLLMDEAKRLSQKFAVLKNGEIKLAMSMFGGGKIEENLKMKIYFQVGTNLQNIEKNLTDTKFLTKGEPKVYFIQIVSKNRFSKSFGEDLMKDFSFIKQTFAYTSYPR